MTGQRATLARRWIVYGLVLATAVLVDSYYPMWWVGIPLALYILVMVTWVQR